MGRFVWPTTTLIGRRPEIASIIARLRKPEVRLLTLTGTGGIGKTRLALRTAEKLRDEFNGGVFAVALAPLTDPDLVVSAIAEALAVPDTGDDLRSNVCEFLRDKRALLILDSFEHLASAALLVSDLLASAPALKVLVTSREILRLSLEHIFLVPPLRLPSLTEQPALEQLARNEALDLFVERAIAVQPNFRLTQANAPIVAQICHSLDGLPLAIELAAARMRHLAPDELFARLERRLSVLVGGPRDLPGRHSTLRSAIAWSYDLLEPSEQVVFRSLAVFAGGFTPRAAEAVCCSEDPRQSHDVLQLITSLVDKSLLQYEPGESHEPRYAMLETVREYALEQLIAAGEDSAVRARFAEYYERLAQEAAPQFLTAQQLIWLARMDAELDNLRSVLQSFLDHDQQERGQALAGELWYFWSIHGPVGEGHGWLTRLLAGPRGRATSERVRARALLALGLCAIKRFDLAASDEALTESLALASQAGDSWTKAMALLRLTRNSVVANFWSIPRQTDLEHNPSNILSPEAARYEEALDLFRQAGDSWGTAICLKFYGDFLRVTGSDRAADIAMEAVQLSRDLGDRYAIAFSLALLPHLAIDSGDSRETRRILEQSLTLYRELNDLHNVSANLTFLAELEMDEANFADAAVLQEQRAAICRLLGNRVRLAHALHDMAVALRLSGDLDGALASYHDSVAVFAELGQPQNTAAVKASLGHLHVHRGAFDVARNTLVESLHVLASHQSEPGIATALTGVGQIALKAGQSADAVRLLGASEVLVQRLQASPAHEPARVPRGPLRFEFLRDSTHVRELRRVCQDAFGSTLTSALQRALEAGQALSTFEAVALALELSDQSIHSH
ncbi:MAG: AAA family ATPase [Chloroflexi bacterium]|nr:AAA family ATPase [Chloroflexota bacterium]